jgi:tRNA-dihydrouridine synthase
VMIGRGIFHDPYTFSQESPWPRLSKNERTALYAKHVKLFTQTWKNKERNIRTLNKFCKVYIEGFPGAKELREKLMVADSAETLLSLLHSAD